jgi:hypothetical protein
MELGAGILGWRFAVPVLIVALSVAGWVAVYRRRLRLGGAF